MPPILLDGQLFMRIGNTSPIQTDNSYFSYQITLNTTYFNATKMTRLMKACTIARNDSRID